MFKIDAFDAEFSRKMPQAEWRRLIAIRSSPTFLAGVLHLAERLPPFFSHNAILNKVVTESRRFELLVYSLYLADSRDPADPRSGLTLANLQRICTERRVASPGRVFAILGIMRLGGYLTRAREEGDSRIVRLEPTQRFLDIVEAWNRMIFETLDIAAPGDDLVGRHEREPRFGFDMRSNGAEAALAGWHLLDAFPELRTFVDRDGGWMLLASIVATTLKEREAGEQRPIAIRLESIGAKLAVSRSHLRRVLEDAHAAGLLEESPRNGARIIASPRLLATYTTCGACEMAFYRTNALAGRTRRTASSPDEAVQEGYGSSIVG